MEAGKGSQDLENEVLSSGLCTSCGACVNVCPYIKIARDRVAVIEPCGLTEGHCYSYCPRTPTHLGRLREGVFGRDRADLALGPHLEVQMGQASRKGLLSRAQYGGVVASLVRHAFESGLIQRAIVTRPFASDMMPASELIGKGSGITAYAGSNYVPSATLAVLNRAKNEEETVGLVGLPCQVLALRKMQAAGNSAANRVNLAIGLFCTWALGYRDFKSFLSARFDLESIKRLDIPPPPANLLRVTSSKGTTDLSLDEVRKFIKPTCTVCYDMTCEFADVSVGMVEGLDKWNTVISRTARGKDLVDSAAKAGAIRMDKLDAARSAHLADASLQKKKKAVAEITRRTGNPDDLLYLRLEEDEKAKLR